MWLRLWLLQDRTGSLPRTVAGERARGFGGWSGDNVQESWQVQRTWKQRPTVALLAVRDVIAVVDLCVSVQ